MPISFVSEDEALAFRLYRGRWRNPRDRDHQIIPTIPMSFPRTPQYRFELRRLRESHISLKCTVDDARPSCSDDNCLQRFRPAALSSKNKRHIGLSKFTVCFRANGYPSAHGTIVSQPSYPRVITQTRGFVTAKDRFYEYRAATRETRSCYAGIPENRAISLYLFATLFQRNDPRYTDSFLDAFHALDTTRKCMWRCHARWALKNSSRREY